MGLFERKSLTEQEVPAARDLFERIIEAERPRLTDEQANDMGAYLIATWHRAAEAVMRPTESRIAIERRLSELQDRLQNLGQDPDDAFP